MYGTLNLDFEYIPLTLALWKCNKKTNTMTTQLTGYSERKGEGLSILLVWPHHD